jgi:hypothetical protein
MKKKPSTKEEKKYMGHIADMPCIAKGCGHHPVEVHHARINTGASMRPPHFDTLPLCHVCHRNSKGSIHNAKRTWQIENGQQADLLIQVRQTLIEEGIYTEEFFIEKNLPFE